MHILTYMYKKSLPYIFYFFVFLYESIIDFILFLILINKQKNRKYKGEIFYTYMLIYAFCRFFLEHLRTDSLMLFNLKMAQVVSILMFIVGMVLILLPIFRRKHDK